jgi:hypothetical protein
MRTRVALSVVCILLITASARAQTVWYVDDDGDAENGCTSWEVACPELQTALSIATAGDQIWVAQGTYIPSEQTDPKDSRSATFQLKSGVGIYGGFAGSESTLEKRAALFDQTILSGDLDGDDDFATCTANDDCSFDQGGLCSAGYCIIPDNNGENSYNVTRASDTDNTAILDGFTIAGGTAVCGGCDEVRRRGGGLWNVAANPTIRNCLFRGNIADEGGAIANRVGSDPTIISCAFVGNAAWGAGGSAMLSSGGAVPHVSNCSFISNHQMGITSAGGAVFNFAIFEPSYYTNCMFVGNLDRSHGGGMHNLGSDVVLTNCLFAYNSAYGGASSGGGVFNSPTSIMTSSNCIFWGNSDIGGVNETSQIGGSGTININYSCVFDWSGKLGGIGNFGDDPLFVDAHGDDDILGTVDDDLHLSSGSPCIDAADNEAVPADETDLDDDGDMDEPIPFDLDGNPRFVEDLETEDVGAGECPVVDMGAYEFQKGITTCCSADLDGDGSVGPYDLALVLGFWGSNPGHPSDLDGDGTVDSADLAILLDQWGPCP